MKSKKHRSEISHILCSCLQNWTILRYEKTRLLLFILWKNGNPPIFRNSFISRSLLYSPQFDVWIFTLCRDWNKFMTMHFLFSLLYLLLTTYLMWYNQYKQTFIFAEIKLDSRFLRDNKGNEKVSLWEWNRILQWCFLCSMICQIR